MDKINYVLGFVRHPEFPLILMIRKNRPDWQKGRLNVIGGHVEQGERPFDAVMRECAEESGLIIPDWSCFVKMHFPECNVYCYKGVADIFKAKTLTDEPVMPVSAERLPDDVIENLRWLIPLSMLKEEVYMPIEVNVLEWDKK